MSVIVRGSDLSRWYGMVMGLNHIRFEVRSGITGLVGPNGAGKSTLIQIITGQLQPSFGELTVFGERPWNHPGLLKRLGYCPERESVPGYLGPVEWLKALGLLAGLSARRARERACELLEVVKLPSVDWGKRLGQYSKGMRQRVKLAQALIHEPELLVLDEPMNGLDPMGRQEIARILKDLTRQGVAIIISSHILAELEALCRDVLIMSWGRVLASGAQSAIREDLTDWSEELTVCCSDPETLARTLFEAGAILGFDMDLKAGILHLRVRSAETFYTRWGEWVAGSGVTVFEMRSESRSLKSLFEKMTA